MTRRAGVSRRVIFRGQGEVDAKVKLNTDVRLAPFNMDLLEISSYEFSSGYERSTVKYLRKVLPEGEVLQNSFEHFPSGDKVFMVAPKIMIFIENLYLTRRAGVSRRVIFRGQGEVGAKLKLSTDVRLAPFNPDFLQISSCEFSRE